MNFIKHHSAGVIVFYLNENSEREYLLLKYPEGHLDFVKGHIDSTDEDLKFTALRELEEETGITDIQLVENYFKSTFYTYYREGVQHDKQVDYFLGKVSSKEIVLSHEHTDFVWLKFSDALNSISYDNAKELLLSAENFLSGN